MDKRATDVMILLQRVLTLELVTPQDLPLLLAWRQDREIMQYLPTPPIVPLWEQEVEWYENICLLGSSFGGKEGYAYSKLPVYRMIRLEEKFWGGRPIGIVHVTAEGEVGIIIGEKALWGTGFGKIALDSLLSLVKERPLCAVIRPDNTRSQRLFASVGFKNTGEPARNGQERWELT